MEEIIAVFEMQMNLCILRRLRRYAVCLAVFMCVFLLVCDCVCIFIACNNNFDFCSGVSLSFIVCASTGDERN